MNAPSLRPTADSRQPRELLRPNLRMHLRIQINSLPLPERDRALAHVVIDALDADGYLRLDLETLAHSLDIEPSADYFEINSALRLVQSLEPRGVAARNTAECLLLQLRGDTCVDLALARCILKKHREALDGHGLPALARRLGRSVAEIETVCRHIRWLDGWDQGIDDRLDTRNRHVAHAAEGSR